MSERDELNMDVVAEEVAALSAQPQDATSNDWPQGISEEINRTNVTLNSLLVVTLMANTVLDIIKLIIEHRLRRQRKKELA